MPGAHLRGKPGDYNTRVRTSVACGAVVLVAWLGCAPALIAQDSTGQVEVRRLAELHDARLRESSGVALSRAHPDLIWTHNDSGDGPYLYATDSAGVVRARIEVRGARNVDWEALTIGPCPGRAWRGRACLFVGDTGDNAEQRSRVVLYAVPEPDPARADSGGMITTPVARALRLHFPDRPRDAEALAALPDGSLTLVTKGRTGPVLRFTIPARAWEMEDFDLASPDTLPIEPRMLAGRWVTDAAVDPSGTRAVVRTYTELYFFRVGARWTLAGPPCRFGFVEPQGEGVAFREDGSLLLTSERTRAGSAVYTVVRCP